MEDFRFIAVTEGNEDETEIHACQRHNHVRKGGVLGGKIIVLGNEKGGTGNSTTAMHLFVALLREGRAVASLDLDSHQGTLTRYIENRR